MRIETNNNTRNSFLLYGLYVLAEVWRHRSEPGLRSLRQREYTPPSLPIPSILTSYVLGARQQ